MVDLAKIQKQTTLQAINSQLFESELRPYLGASAIGHPCDRYLWYAFRWCFKEKISYRQHRLFSRGHREEPLINTILDSVGIRTFDDQQEVVFGFGHCKGHNDGKSVGVIEAPKTVHLNEYKTMNDANFKKLKKSCVQLVKPIYYVQCQLYMKFLKLTRTLFVAINKNDDDIHIERIKYDKEVADEAEKRAEAIILSEEPPEKRFEPTWYECKFCSAKLICHGSDPVEKSCRTCSFCDILPKGLWACDKYEIQLATGQQRLACGQYNKLSFL